MQLRQLFVPFALGVAVGVLLHKNWPRIREVGGPLLRDALRGGAKVASTAREAMHDQSEKFSDLVAEIREEEAARARAAAAPSSTGPTDAA